MAGPINIHYSAAGEQPSSQGYVSAYTPSHLGYAPTVRIHSFAIYHRTILSFFTQMVFIYRLSMTWCWATSQFLWCSWCGVTVQLRPHRPWPEAVNFRICCHLIRLITNSRIIQQQQQPGRTQWGVTQVAKASSFLPVDIIPIVIISTIITTRWLPCPSLKRNWAPYQLP